MIEFKLNGETRTVDVDLSTPLLWVLRDELKLKGTKFGCGAGLCGACTVHINGDAVRSCTYPIKAAAGAVITTIEGLSAQGQHPVQQQWIKERVPQCGYCQPGMIMAAAAFLDKNPRPSESDIRRSITNICRCGTYNRVVDAISAVAATRTSSERGK
ncbi:MAG: isoquinoline 1-oxidoreductase alpha subunit [Gammaproteobacteria bacterium]|jgi:isoquinoline 1-oxidoreductase alpha subunit